MTGSVLDNHQLLSPNWNGVAGAQLNPIFVNGARPPVLPQNQPYYQSQPQAGYGGDIWGAYGGGVTPIGNGVTGPTGWDKPVANTLADTETATNYVPALPNQNILSQESTGAMSASKFDDTLPTGGNNQG